MKILKLSRKGQITLPKVFREKIRFEQYAIELHDNIIILMPVKIEPLAHSQELDEFGRLAEKSFDFWNNKNDDIYETFYQQGS